MKKILNIFFLFSFFCFGQNTIILTDDDIKGFPGAVAHGENAMKNSGGTINVRFVTNCNDTGAGSFRQALLDAVSSSTQDYIIFRTACSEIQYDADFYIGPQSGSGGNIYVAGQTAPGGGIAIRHLNSTANRNLYLRGSDIIVRHIRFRGGDGPNTDAIKVGDNNMDYAMGDIIIDHCSFSHGEDEVISITTKLGNTYTDAAASITNVTFSNNLIGGGLGPRYAMLAYGENIFNLSVVRNLFTNNRERHMLSNGIENETEFINNIVYNFISAYVGTVRQKLSVIGNIFDEGNLAGASNFTVRLNDCSTQNCPPSGDSNYTGTQTYYDDNTDNSTGNGAADYDPDMITYLQPSRVVASSYNPESTAVLENLILNDVGAGAGTSQGLDSFDQGQLDDYNNKTGSYETSWSGVTLSSGTAYTDTDSDGLSDDYELAQGGTATSIVNSDRPATAVIANGDTVDQSGVTNFATEGFNHIKIFLSDLAGDWNKFPANPISVTVQGRKSTNAVLTSM